jgi:hypothetical protein
VQDLEAGQAGVVFANLSDTDAVLAAIIEG